MPARPSLSNQSSRKMSKASRRLAATAVLLMCSLGRGSEDATGATVDPANPPADAPAAQLHAAQLHAAVHAGDVESLRSLLSAGAAAAAVDERGMSALHWASLTGDETIATLLIDAERAAVNMRNAKGSVPLHLCSLRGHAGVAAALLGAGAEVDVPNAEGNTPLHAAAEHGNTDVVLLLLEAGAAASVPNPREGWTPLHLTALHGHYASAKALLDAGAHADAIARGGAPLHMAAHKGNVDLLRLLVERGAQVDGGRPVFISFLFLWADWGARR